LLDGLVLEEVTRAPAHGYAVRRSLARRGIDVAGSTVYAILRRLERDALLTARWQNGRSRRVYRVTGAGREALHVRRFELRSSA
jgi:DNA-binding PadR family transcriptional regulator